MVSVIVNAQTIFPEWQPTAKLPTFATDNTIFWAALPTVKFNIEKNENLHFKGAPACVPCIENVPCEQQQWKKKNNKFVAINQSFYVSGNTRQLMSLWSLWENSVVWCNRSCNAANLMVLSLFFSLICKRHLRKIVCAANIQVFGNWIKLHAQKSHSFLQ